MTFGRECELKPSSRNFVPYRAALRRIVEGQHEISTDRLVDDPAEQEVLESLIDEVKPIMPAAARALHRLLGTPFRYGYEKPTRFRRPIERPGIFYASELSTTAVSEAAFYRLRFFAASPGVLLTRNTTEYLEFSIVVDVKRALDLTAQPFSRDRRRWVDPNDYSACQDFASQARELDTQLIRYESARDPSGGANVALFDPEAFQKPVPTTEQSWHFRFTSGNKLTAFAALPSQTRHDFTFEQFGLRPII